MWSATTAEDGDSPAFPLVRACVEPPPESNRRPHPYHESAAKRRAIGRLRRSQRTVDAAVMGSVTSWSRARAGFESSTFHQRRLIQTLDVLGVGSEVLVEPAGPVSGGGSLASSVRASSASWVSSSLSRMAKGSARSLNGTSGIRRRTPRTNGGPRRASAVDARLRPLACLQITPAWVALDGRPVRQFGVAAVASGLMWANMLRVGRDCRRRRRGPVGPPRTRPGR